jgi:hypothetical protein
MEIVNAIQFANFDREFCKIAMALKKATLIKELKMWCWYYNGLDPIICMHVDQCLEVKTSVGRHGSADMT